MRVFFCLKFCKPKIFVQFAGQLLDFIYWLDPGSPQMEYITPCKARSHFDRLVWCLRPLLEKLESAGSFPY